MGVEDPVTRAGTCSKWSRNRDLGSILVLVLGVVTEFVIRVGFGPEPVYWVEGSCISESRETVRWW